MIVLIDNYDSFVYNLYQYLRQLGREVRVIRNDRITGRELLELAPEAVVISPGPGNPDGAGNVLEMIGTCHLSIPMLGICLGHQAIGQFFGGRVVPARSICHGKTDILRHRGQGLFRDLPGDLLIARYHSLVVEADSLPDCLDVQGRTDDATVMAIRHRDYPVYGLQFHPESIMTDHGMAMLSNFLEEVVPVC